MRSLALRVRMMTLRLSGMFETRHPISKQSRLPSFTQRSTGSTVAASVPFRLIRSESPSQTWLRVNDVRASWRSAPRARTHSTASGGGGGGAGGNSSGGGGSGSGGSSGGGGSGPWDRYLHALETNPVLTKAISAAVLNGLGDLIAQLVVEKKERPDLRRLATFTGLGLVWIGPALHYWYSLVGRLVPQPGFVGAIGRLALDQLLWAPAFVASIFASLCVLEGHPENIMAKLKQDWKNAVLANWKLWVPFQFVNFRYVPPNLRVLFSNFVALIWNVYISFASHLAIKAP